MEVTIGPDGSPSSASIRNSSGELPPYLEKALIESALASRWKPAEGPSSQPVEAKVSVVFEL